MTPDRITIHCSDSEWGNADVIDEWHKKRGWDGIGYHYVILNGYPTYNEVMDRKPTPRL